MDRTSQRDSDGLPRSNRTSPAGGLAVAQGVFYVGTGVWPLLSRRSFEAVTGRKTDWWLVQTVGVLVTVIGATLAGAGAAGRAGPDLRRLGAGAAIGLAAIDVVHAARGRISKVYLLDAAGEAVLATAWLVLGRAQPAAEARENTGGGSRPLGRLGNT